MEVTRVLLIDDDEDDYLLLVDYLQDIKHRIFEVEWASSYKQGLKRLQESSKVRYNAEKYIMVLHNTVQYNSVQQIG